MKIYKPTSPGRRGMTRVDFSVLDKKKPEKSLLLKLKRRAGRSSSGRITVRHQSGGAKKLYRIIDFKQDKLNMPAEVMAIEYDPYRTAFIALIKYEDGEKKYVIAPQGLKKDDKIIAGEKTEIKIGNRTKLKNIPVGTAIYNIELEPDRGGKIARSAGTSAKVLAREGGYVNLKLSSTEYRRISENCYASIGAVSRQDHAFEKIGKAGRARHKGRRPTVRGSAMNPVSHPHGGGEGRSPIGMSGPKTPWGKPARGVKTRGKKWTDKLIIKRRNRKKKK